MIKKCPNCKNSLHRFSLDELLMRAD